MNIEDKKPDDKLKEMSEEDKEEEKGIEMLEDERQTDYSYLNINNG